MRTAAKATDDRGLVIVLTSFRRALTDWVRGYPNQRALVKQGLKLGTGVFLGEGVYIDPGHCWLISIGDDTVITRNTVILAHDATTRRSLGYTRLGRVTIGKAVFIGTGSIILPGVAIGDGAVIGAGSVVSRDVPPQTLAAGNPARVIKPLGDFLAKHREQMQVRPLYPRAGWTLAGRISAAHKRRQWEELASGEGYVE